MIGAETTAPPFELAGANGLRVRLADLTGEGPVALAFFKVTCPVCQFTFPFLQRLASSSGAVVGISQDDPAATAEFCRDFGITFPMLFDSAPRYPVSNAYGITHVPSVFLIERDGRVALAGSGFSRSDLETIAARLGASAFREGEQVPDFRPG